jgi:hypothetical protein
MDVDAKNSEDWKFGDILAYDMYDKSEPNMDMLRMFITRATDDAFGATDAFYSLDLFVLDSRSVLRGAQWWMRIEKTAR